MDANDVLALGLGVTPPWKLVGQRLDMTRQPNELHLEIEADRGTLFPCPVCSRACKAHDFAEFTWRHLNFFQHHCSIIAKLPRSDCPEHGVLRINVPWAREGSRFTLLFEQVAITLVREMPVLAAARIIGITDQRLWRIVEHYVGKAVERLDLTRVKAIGLDETAAKRGQTYVTVFIDLDRKHKPVVFVTPGRGKDTVARFKTFLAEHGGSPNHIVEVVCDMSGAFLAAVGKTFEDAVVTVDWFHVVQMFTKAVDEVRRAEAKHNALPKALRWAILKRADGRLPGPRPTPWPNSKPPISSLPSPGGSGDAPLDPQSRQRPGRPLAHHPLPAPRQGTPRRGPHPRPHAQGAELRRQPPRAHPAALDLVSQQRPPRRPQRPVPGRQSTRSRLPQHHNLRDHDLPHRRPPGRPLQST